MLIHTHTEKKNTHQMLFPHVLTVRSISFGDTLMSLVMLMTCRALRERQGDQSVKKNPTRLVINL